MNDGFVSDSTQFKFDNLNFNLGNFSNGIEVDVSEEEIRRWMANPEDNKEKLANYAMYQYISNGDIFQLFDLARVSPSLNYKIKNIKVNSKTNKNILICRKALKELNHKELTRDIISQTITTGTLVGLWVGGEPGNDETPYLMIFDDLEYFFPGVRKRGKWSVWCDLKYFDGVFEDDEKAMMLENLSPYVTMSDYKNYKVKGDEYRFIEFPIERSVCIRTHTQKRNQRFGIPWNTQAIEDIKHKQKLRNLEKVASNKVMNAVAVLTLGIHEDGGNGKSTYKQLGNMTKTVFSSVKTGLMNNKEGEASVVGLPEWAKLEYPEQKTDVLDPDKMISVNEDVNNATGVARTLTNGKGGNYASAKLNLDILFTKIGELLEHIENEVYNKLFALIIKGDEGKEYYLEYEKTVPLTNTEKMNMLHKLVSLGYSLRPLVEMLGLDFDEYINNSLFEIEKLKLREKIFPPMSTYTANGESPSSSSGNTDVPESENQNTINSKESDSNNTPKAK